MRRTAWAMGVCAIVSTGAKACAQTQPTHPNLTYAPIVGRALELDLYMPTTGAPPYPVVVWVHGGGWQSGARFPAPLFVLQLRQRGVAVASVTYRLTSQAGHFGPLPVIFPAQVHDVKGAVRWLRASADVYGLDVARFGVWGSSAGGHLAALVATSAGVAEAEGVMGGNLEWSSAVRACVDYYGPTDLLQMNPDVTTPPGGSVNHDAPSSPESRLLGWTGTGQGVGNIRANIANPAAPYPALVALASLANPVAHVDAGDPPTMIVHGAEDTVVAQRQSERLRDALQAAGVRHEFIVVPGAGHGGFPTAVNDAAVEFLVRELTRCAADFDGDGQTASPDLAMLLGAWGEGPGVMDLSADGLVGAPDLAILLGGWGACQ